MYSEYADGLFLVPRSDYLSGFPSQSCVLKWAEWKGQRVHYGSFLRKSLAFYITVSNASHKVNLALICRRHSFDQFNR